MLWRTTLFYCYWYNSRGGAFGGVLSYAGQTIYRSPLTVSVFIVQNDSLSTNLSVLLRFDSKRDFLLLCGKCSALLPLKKFGVISGIVFRVKGIAFLQSVAWTLPIIYDPSMTFFFFVSWRTISLEFRTISRFWHQAKCGETYNIWVR
jgi:hypothetical protein